MAASLAFTTLLGIVPLFTVALAYVARFPVFERWLDALEPFLVTFLSAGQQQRGAPLSGGIHHQGRRSPGRRERCF